MKKKIVILSCNGGGGHRSAASAITSYLEPTYTVITKDALGDILAPIDPTYHLSFKKKTGQDIYNFLLRHNQKRLTNILYTIGNKIIQRKQETIANLLIRYFEQEKPDLVISVIPIINNPIFTATQHLGIPYLLVPTDLDCTTFLTNLRLPQSQGTTLCLGFDYPEVQDTINLKHIHPDTIMVTGFPLGAQFFEKKHKKTIKKDLSIEKSKPVILLMMGAVGSWTTIAYIRALSKVKIPFHLLACTGRNNVLQKKIRAMILPEHMSISIIDTSHDISDMMAIADLCITKPGSVTFAEALYMNVPTLLDATNTTLVWEALNIKILDSYNLGMIINDLDEIPGLITHHFTNPFTLNIMKKNSAELPKKYFGQYVPTIIHTLLNQPKKAQYNKKMRTTATTSML